jgi:hypothetical protein
MKVRRNFKTDGKPWQELATHWCVERKFTETSKQAENLGGSWQHTGVLSESSQKLQNRRKTLAGAGNTLVLTP